MIQTTYRVKQKILVIVTFEPTLKNFHEIFGIESQTYEQGIDCLYGTVSSISVGTSTLVDSDLSNLVRKGEEFSTIPGLVLELSLNLT